MKYCIILFRTPKMEWVLRFNDIEA